MKYNNVLFLCVENAGRSKMAEAFGKKLGIRCESAGTVPSQKMNPDVKKALEEKNIHVQDEKPRLLTVDMINRSDLVVIMGCSVEESCPAPMANAMKKKVIDWGLDDPKGKSMDEIRLIRDQIETKVRELLVE